jgi:hypothetical protein
MKRQTLAISAILILVASLLAVAGDTATKSEPSGRISTEISVFPTDQPDVWMGEAIVTDIETGEILTQPRVRFNSGEEAKLRTGGMLGPDAKDEYYVLLEVFVGAAGENAKYTSTVSIGGEIVSKQSASFKLK